MQISWKNLGKKGQITNFFLYLCTTKIGRNDPCPCGSGLKYKKCHGKK